MGVFVVHVDHVSLGFAVLNQRPSNVEPGASPCCKANYYFLGIGGTLGQCHRIFFADEDNVICHCGIPSETFGGRLKKAERPDQQKGEMCSSNTLLSARQR